MFFILISIFPVEFRFQEILKEKFDLRVDKDGRVPLNGCLPKSLRKSRFIQIQVIIPNQTLFLTVAISRTNGLSALLESAPAKVGFDLSFIKFF